MKIFEEYKKSICDDYSLIGRFERQLEMIFGVNHAIAINSGTSAIHCAIMALGIKEGDQIIVPSVCVVMSVMPIIYCGAIPIFVDCQKDSIDFDYADLESKITKETKAIIPVYMFGMSYDMDRLMNLAKKYELFVIEDACQAHGSQWKNKYLGTFGDIGCFSLKDGKLFSCGEGGFILTNNNNVALLCRRLITHDTCKNEPIKSFQIIAYNYRLTNVQAYLAINSFESFEDKLKNRKAKIEKFYEMLSKNQSFKRYNTQIHESPNCYSPVLLQVENDKIKLSELFADNGIINSVGSFALMPAHRREAIANYLRSKGRCDIKDINSMDFLNKCIALVIDPQINAQDLKTLADKIIDFKEGEEG